MTRVNVNISLIVVDEKFTGKRGRQGGLRD